MKCKISETRVTVFTRTRNFLITLVKHVILLQPVWTLWKALRYKLHLHAHVNYIASQSARMLGLIRNITHSFYTPESLLILYLKLIKTELEYASIVRNSMSSIGAKKKSWNAFSGISKPYVKPVSLLTLRSRWFSWTYRASHPARQKTTLIHYFLFLSIQV